MKEDPKDRGVSSLPHAREDEKSQQGNVKQDGRPKHRSLGPAYLRRRTRVWERSEVSSEEALYSAYFKAFHQDVTFQNITIRRIPVILLPDLFSPDSSLLNLRASGDSGQHSPGSFHGIFPNTSFRERSIFHTSSAAQPQQAGGLLLPFSYIPTLPQRD